MGPELFKFGIPRVKKGQIVNCFFHNAFIWIIWHPAIIKLCIILQLIAVPMLKRSQLFIATITKKFLKQKTTFFDDIY